MSSRVEELAKRFEQTNEELIATVQACSDEQWRKSCSDEGWSVGVTAHHVATAYGPIAGIVQALASGQPVPGFTMEQLDANNAEHARQFAVVTKDETVEQLRRGSREAAAVLRGLSDEQLDNAAEIPLLGNQRVSASQIVEMGMIGHPTGHLASIRTAL